MKCLGKAGKVSDGIWVVDLVDALSCTLYLDLLFVCCCIFYRFRDLVLHQIQSVGHKARRIIKYRTCFGF